MSKPRPRRGWGDGSVYQRSDGYWVAQTEAGRYPNGRRRYARAVRKTEPKARKALRELRIEIQDGEPPDRTRTLATYLDYWVTDVMAGTVADGTLAEYRKRIKRITPSIGHVKLAKLRAPHVQSLANALAEKYPRSPKTQSLTLQTLRQALRWAVGADLLAKNVAEFVSGPRAAVATIDDTLTADEAEAIVEAARGDDIEALVWLALKYGLRIGELLNLRWPDIDFVGGELTVRQAKTAAGVRSLPIIDEAEAVLRTHRKRSKVHTIDGYVFAGPEGGKRTPQRTRELWNVILERAGIEHKCRNCESAEPCSTAVRRFHVSRHSAATLLLESGVPLEVVSAVLGHSSIGITANIYAKVRSDLKRQGLSQPGAGS